MWPPHIPLQIYPKGFEKWWAVGRPPKNSALVFNINNLTVATQKTAGGPGGPLSLKPRRKPLFCDFCHTNLP